MMAIWMNTAGVTRMKRSVWCLSAVLSVMALPAWADNPACQYRAEGRQDKVEKLEKKLERDRAKLEQLQDELKELQALGAQ
jgi:septal ring factor EnvC (AmiA/AmiB activator)